jgi:putative endonuclease
MNLTTNLPHRIHLGQLGEAYAAAYLEQHGYRLVAANFTIPVGRNTRGAVINTELDLVAYDEETLCFIEVKTRASDWFAGPEINVNLRKRRQIARAARAYRRLFELEDQPYRYDVVSIVLTDDGNPPNIEILRNFWNESQLKKRVWNRYYHD